MHILNSSSMIHRRSAARYHSVFAASLLVFLLAIVRMPAGAQQSGAQFVSAAPGPAVAAHHGSQVDVPLKLAIRSGHHIQSNTPAEEYLIPSALTWDTNPAVALKGVTYPKAESVKYDFSEKPLSVFSGALTVTSHFAVPADAPRGPVTLTGKFRYQACNDKMCFPPRTLPVSVNITVE